MRRCIYCTQDKPQSEFNVDHVVPQQLGRFHPDNLTLTCVCRQCNQYFGDGIELLLGRDSYEGLMRLAHGVKPPSEAGQFAGARVEFRVPDGSAWARVRLRLGASTDGTHVVMDLPAQIGIKHPFESQFRYFLADEFAVATDKELDIRQGSKFKLLASDDASDQRLRALITQRVPTFRIEGPMPPPPTENSELEVEIQATLDKSLARAIAKIGFNYLAYVAGAEFVLAACFDRVRSFTRQGEGERSDFVRLRNEPILGNETRRYRMTEGHLAVVEWHDGTSAIRARVSPFNAMTYEISLCRSFAGVWRPIESGHVFDWESHTVVPLSSAHRAQIIIAPSLFPP